MKILLCGSMLEYNLGLPSLLEGAEVLLHKIFPDKELELVYYEIGRLKGKIPEDVESDVRYIPFPDTNKLLFAVQLIEKTLLYKLGIKRMSNAQRQFFDDLASAELVVDIYGIMFCHTLDKKKFNSLTAKIFAIGDSCIGFFARNFFGKHVIKTASSYGPFEKTGHEHKARFAYKHIYHEMFAREVESGEELSKVIGKNAKVPVTPDLANLLPYESTPFGENRKIGFSVSHQIARQWKSESGYYECIVALIEHIQSSLPGYDIILLPNETSPAIEYNDQVVAAEINKLLKTPVQVFEKSDYSPQEMKSIIAQCNLFVSSRYHSCVASLSAGIPTLIIGWHYKYLELIRIYEQEGCIISSEDCNPDALIKMFDELFEKRKQENANLIRKAAEIKDRLIKEYTPIFKDAEKKVLKK